ncbi:MAG TPA: glycosyltransferase family 4 protein [Bacteroidota bacterium]|nr:glycosyltransferase family 4 protein [Bacteroidota bacterium]
MDNPLDTGRARRVLIVSAFHAPCIDDDAAIIAAAYKVSRATGSGPAALLRAARGVFSADIIYCWFLSVYGAVAVLLGSLLGRRSIIVIGGVDVARDPGTGYGLWVSPWKAFLARRALRAADFVLAVAETLRDDAVRLAGYDGRNIRYLPTGYDPGFWTEGGAKEPRVLCVAAVSDRPRLAVKGIDVLVEAARRIPEIPVTVVGVDARFVPGLDPPSNVTFLPGVPRAELPAHYRGAKVYCQPSRREGLPNALCEAMLCGCIPVATDAGASAHAVGDTGFIVPAGDPGALADALRLAVKAPGGMGDRTRSRIATLFTLERRRAELSDLLGSLQGFTAIVLISSAPCIFF